MTDAVALLGRLLMSAIFLRGGVLKLMAPAATIGMFSRLHLPVPGAAYALAILVEVGCGALVLLGWRARPAALALGAWCIATAAVAHWHPADTGQMIHFMKNLCMAGGFLFLWAFGPGRFSVDRR
jgi:putative oxidoreductase